MHVDKIQAIISGSKKRHLKKILVSYRARNALMKVDKPKEVWRKVMILCVNVF